MAQELIDKIRAQAQAKGIDPDIAVQIARAESSLRPGVGAKTTSAGGLFGVIDSTWKEFGGAPGKKFDPDENIRVGTAVIAQNTGYLKKILNRDPRPAEVYAAHYFGPAGAKSFLQAAPDTPILDILGKKAIDANPNLKGKTAQEVMAQLERKMGTTSAKSAPDVSRGTRPSAPGPTPAEQMMEPALRSGMTAQAPIGDKFSDLGAGYQAALALSFLSDTDDKEDRDIDREPGIAEQWLAQQAPRSTALAEIADITIKSPFAEPPKPLALAHGGEVAHLAMGGFPYMPTARITSSARKQLDDIKAQYDTYNTQADSYNKQADTYQAEVDAYNAAAEAYNAGDRSSAFSRTEPVAPTAPVAPSVTPEQYDAMAKKAAKNVAGRNLALQVAANPEQFNFSMDRLFAEGGEVGEESAPDVGRPTVSETQLAKAVFPDLPVAEAVYLIRGGQRQSTPQGEMLSGNLGAQVPLGKDASVMLMLSGSRPERSMSESKALMAAFNKRVGDEGGLDINVVRPLDAPPGIFAGGLSASYPLGDGRISGNINALKLPDQGSRITGYGVGYGGRVGPGNLSAQIMKQKDGPYSGQIEYRLPIGRADGGEVEGMQAEARKGEAYQSLEKYLRSRGEMPDIKVTANLPEGTDGMYSSDNLNIGSGTIKINKNTPKAALASLLAHETTHAADRQMKQQAMEQGLFGRRNQYTEAYEKLVGPEGRNRTELARRLKPEWAEENRLYRADPKEIAAHGVGAFSGPTLQTRGPRHVDATAATEFQVLMDLAQRNVDKGPTGLEKIPAFFRKMGRYAEGGDVQQTLTPQQIERMAEKEAAERENASKPAFLTPKSGIGRKISTKTGELESAALQGVSEMPYNLLGAPVDLATMAMRPFGYDVEKPMGGSEDLKQRALDAGIRQKPPEGKAARALYELTQAGASAVNPAAPVRGAVAAAEKTGEAAKMLARDFQQYNQQLSVPGASYAVRNRGTPFMMSYGNKLTEGPDGKFLSMDQPENYVRSEVATTMDDKLNEWLLNRVPAYLRRDFATPDDQFVKAADANQLLHFVNKPVKRRDLDPYYDRADNISGIDSLPYVRQTEGFDPQGTAKTEYGKRAESLTDASAWPVQLQDITSPGLIPPNMRNMAETSPTARLTELGTNIDSTLQLPELAADMAKMRRMPKTFSVYSQPPVKVPEEYLLTDEALGGLTLAQASNRVAKFRKWEEETRQGMASTAVFKDPSISRTPAADGHVWVNPPDLEFNPAMRELIQDVGCDGGWCTKGASQALSYGSGENRLSVLMDSKARPKAQITIKSSEPTTDDFLMSMDDAEAAQFKAAYPDLPLYDTRAIRETPEYREWAAINPPRTEITEIKGVNNETDLTDAPYLKQIQQRIKDLDSRGDLQSVDNLDGIGMREIPPNPYELLNMGLDFRERNELSKMFGEKNGLQMVRDEVLRMNSGSRFLSGNEDEVANLIREAAINVLRPQQRATGGMIERQSTDSRKYL